MLKGAFSLVTTSNGCIWHYKFDLNVKKAMFLSSFKVPVGQKYVPETQPNLPSRQKDLD